MYIYQFLNYPSVWGKRRAGDDVPKVRHHVDAGDGVYDGQKPQPGQPGGHDYSGTPVANDRVG